MTALDLLPPIDRGRGLAEGLLRGVGSAALSLLVVLGAWQLFLVVFDVDPFVGRTPADVWAHLVTAPGAAAHRAELASASLITLRDSVLGLGAGTAVALIAAVAFDRWRPVGRAMMPLAIGLQSVPLVALTPLIALVFGRSLATTTVIGGLVTFFPTLVIVNLALAAVPRDTADLLRAYGASRSTTLRLAQIPGAMPALATALRIAMPLAVIGALLAEWLVTGEGMGFLMLRSTVTFRYDQLWSAAWLVTAFSILLYSVVSAFERHLMSFRALP